MKKQIKKIEPLKEIAPLIASVQLKDIRLVEASVSTRIRSAREAGEVNLAISKSADIKDYHMDDGILWVLARFRMQLTPVEPGKDAAISVNAAFEIKYSFPKELKVSEGQLKTFAKIQGIFNAWPYWREFVQNMVARMNLPPITLSVFRLEDTAKIKRKNPVKPR